MLVDIGKRLRQVESEICLFAQDVNADQLVMLREYANLLYRWSGKINLIALGDRECLSNKHIMPSLIMGSVVRMVPHRVILDFGSGGGLPGIPLKIIFPDSELILIESKRRKANFLREVVRNLGLEQVEVMNVRIEDWICENRGKVDIVVSRAVAAPEMLLQLVSPCLVSHGVVVSTMGGRDIETGRIIPGYIMKKKLIWSGGGVGLGVMSAK